jgi:cation:H+ antiporter
MAAISLQDLGALGGAVLLAALGGEAFLRGVLGTAAWLRLPKLLVATTLAAFATSCPELIVSTLSALAGEPGIGLGNVLGANVVNLTLTLGIALLIAPLHVSRSDLGRDFALAIGVPLVLLLMAQDGAVGRLDGLLLLALFATWLTLLVRSALAHGRQPYVEGSGAAAPRPGLTLLLAGVGVVVLVLSGHLFVTGASGIAHALGVSPFIIGAVVVAIGTSMPEFVTMLLSRLRGQDEVGVGTLLGSLLFNGLAIVGTAATIHPIAVAAGAMTPAVAIAVLALLLLLPGPSGLLGRRRGLLLLAAYVTFVSLSLA